MKQSFLESVEYLYCMVSSQFHDIVNAHSNFFMRFTSEFDLLLLYNLSPNTKFNDDIILLNKFYTAVVAVHTREYTCYKCPLG